MPTAYPRLRLSRLLLFVVLAVSGWLINRFSLSLAFNIDFIFGSVTALLAIRLLGVLRGTAVAIIAASMTFVLWGHPYAWIIFTLEALFVGSVLRIRLIQSLVVADTLYWVVLGMPLIWLTYGQILGLPTEQVWVIALKQPLNGVTNAILASLLMLLLPINWIKEKTGSQVDPRIGIRELSFTLIIAIVYLAVITMMVEHSRNLRASLEAGIEQELQEDARQLQLYLANSRGTLRQEDLLNIFDPGIGNKHHGIIITDARGEHLQSSIKPEVAKEIIQQARRSNQDLQMQIWHPQRNNMPLMRWWNNSYYFVHIRINHGDYGSVVMLYPMDILVSRIHKNSIDSLQLLVIVLVIAMLVAIFISRAFSKTIRQLVDITDNLPNKLRSGEVMEWPISRVLELDSLSRQSSIMSQEIFSTFKGYESSTEELNQKVRTTSEALDENYMRSSAIIAGSLEGILTIDEHGIIETFNSAAEKMFGYQAREIIGASVLKLIPEAQNIDRATFMDRYLSKRNELMARRQDGTEFPIELSVSEIRLKDRTIYTGFISDISKRKETERLKNEFISTVSHELRTPLTAIRGAIGLLSAKESNGLGEKSRQLLDITLSNTQRLVRLINDILDIQKLEAGSMSFSLSQEKLLPIIKTVIQQNENYVEQFDVHLGMEFPDADIYIMTNVDRLNQVLTNLISNAAKFSPAGSSIKLVVVEVDGKVRIEVQDQGSGIPPEFQQRIFEKFSQADSSSSRRYSGTGLGLSISKGFVEQMGGSIDFRTSPEQGTVFFVTFPMSQSKH